MERISLYNIVSRFVDMQKKTKHVSKTNKIPQFNVVCIFLFVCVYCVIVFILLLYACILLLIVLVSGWWMYVLCYSKNSPAPRKCFFSKLKLVKSGKNAYFSNLFPY